MEEEEIISTIEHLLDHKSNYFIQEHPARIHFTYKDGKNHKKAV